MYKIFYGYAAAICMRYTTKKEDLVEVVNDGFLKIFNDFKNFRGVENNNEAIIRGWIKRIMINTSIDYYRKYYKNEPTIIETDTQLEIEIFKYETPVDKLSYDELIRLIQQLSPMYKMVFNLFVIDGLSHDEISERLNISVGTSKSNLSKARMNIIKLIETNYKVSV
ncbi:MAG: RNA polymerase sigma factor [Chitinophagaceae bacterium]